MRIKRELFGFTIEVNRRGRATLKLTFEEIPTRVFTRKKHYYCCVDVGFYEKKANGRWVFERTGYFEIEDWCNTRLYTKKRNKLRSMLGVAMFDELVYTVNKLVEGQPIESDHGYRLEQFG